MTADGPVAVLVGPPGAGKTSVGRALAELVGVTFLDTDEEVERRTGTLIADIFVDEGEPRFRELERLAVADAMSGQDGVVSLGGGAVLDPVSRGVLGGRPVAFLDVTVAAATRRLGLDAPRPVLLHAPRATWLRLMGQRRPVYEELARTVVDTSELSVVQAAQQVAHGLGLAVPAELR